MDSGRGRIVMLVDNAVAGDSRVQKTARSAADAGWAVTLLGRSPDHELHAWRIGSARVRLLPVGAPPRGTPPRGTLPEALSGAPRGAPPGASRGAPPAGAGPVAGGRWPRRWLRRLPPPVLAALRRPVDEALVRFWTAVLGDRAWRRLEPALRDFEHAFGPVVDDLAPDIIHAHDFRMIGVGANAKRRRPGVRLVWDAHEYLPGIRPHREHARWLPAHEAYLREHAPHADAVVTVSTELATLLRREHRLAVPPAVVLNAPDLPDDADPPPRPGLRERCGIGQHTPLLVYGGAAAPARGLATMVEALPALPGVHAALVINQPAGAHAADLVASARRAGVADRVHLLGYVPHESVVPFLAEADAGVIPIHHYLNHEISLVTKFFEYSHARLPIIVSDVRTMAATVRRTGQGEVFRAGDVADYVRAVRAVLAAPARYRAAYDAPGLLSGWTWRRQAEVLDWLYARLACQSVRAAPGPPANGP